MRIQLRPFHADAKLAEVYSRPYDHTHWPIHVDRVAWTVAHGIDLARECHAVHLVDLACGDAAITKGIRDNLGYETKMTLGDLFPANGLDIVGPIEESIQVVSGDLLVLTETVEHLRDPDAVLRAARSRFRCLLLTTPIGETNEKHDNEEHYWSWMPEDISGMLTEAGWTPYRYSRLDTTWYDFQLWGCR